VIVERSMAKNIVAHRPPISRGLHPLVYGTAVGLVVWFVLCAWVLFDRQNDAELPLVMVSVLLFVAVSLPYMIWLVWRRDQRPRPTREDDLAFRDWASGQVEVGQSRLKGTDAMIDMLLPLAAVAFGLMALGIVFAFSG